MCASIQEPVDTVVQSTADAAISPSPPAQVWQ